MNQLTPQQMEKKAVLMRARNEASIVRAYFLNEVLPTIEVEYDRRLAAGQDTNIAIPSAVAVGQAFIAEFEKANRPALGDIYDLEA